MPSTTEGHDTLTGFRLDVMPGESPLMSYSKWTELGYPTRVMNISIKMRLGYGEHETFELQVSGQQYHGLEINYIMVMGNNVSSNTLQYGPLVSGLYIYRVDSIERIGMKGSMDNRSNLNCVARLTCTLDVLATLYLHENNGGTHTAGFTLNARWNRLPFRAVIEPFQVRPAQMERNSTQNLPVQIITAIDGNNGTRQLCWVEMVVAHSGIARYGTFADISEGQNNTHTQYDSGTWDLYPSLKIVMGFPTRITSVNISASEILSVAITARCPYKYKMKTVEIAGVTYTYPVLLQDDGVTEVEFNPGAEVANQRWSAYITDKPNGPGTAEYEGEFTLNDSLQLFSSKVMVYDVNENIVGSIDTRYADFSPTEELPDRYVIHYKTRTYFNDNVHITEIELKDGTLIRFPEGNVSFISDSWNEYARAQLLYDRELLAMSQDKIMTDTALGLSNALVNGAFGGIAGGVGLGALTGAASGITSVISAMQERQMNERGQAAKENLMKNTADTLFSTNSGYGYVICLRFGRYGFIAMNQPKGVTASEVDEYLKYAGYPVTDTYVGVTMVQLNTTGQGFLRANALLNVIEGNPTKVCTGYLRNVLDRQLRQGIHFKVIT